MKPPALEYRYAADDTWRLMPHGLAQVAFAPREIAAAGVDACLPPVVRLFSGQAVEAVSVSGRAGFIRLAR